MSFSRKQQGLFRPLVAQAWARDCERNGLLCLVREKPAQRQWYESQLVIAVGHTSTSDLDPARDFEDVMAHFESLVGDSIYWQMRKHGGDARRILHAAAKVAPGFECDDHYFRGIARQALRLDYLPELHDLTKEQVVIVLRAVQIELRREKKRGVAPQLPVDKIDIPF